MSEYLDLKKKINSKEAVITVMGLGYVGLPIAFELCKKGYTVRGLDKSAKRVNRLKKRISYIDDISASEVKKVFNTKRFSVTTKDTVIADSDIIIVCVPTPLRKVKEPDVSYILSAARSLARNLRPGQNIIIESTTYPGTTREVILPPLEKSGLELDKDFFLSFSPERIDPGNPKYRLTNIPKVIGGLTKKSTDLGKLLYSKIIKRVVGVSTAEAAEVTKLLENTFRIVNIGLINEFAMLCNKLGIDVWEVVEAAKTKPFGFMPFYPGPGIGGHCIPADPMYLSWKARKVGFETKMIDIAADTNRNMPKYAVKRAVELLRKNKVKAAGANILILGVAYKKDVNDLRESPALDIIKLLKKKGVKLEYHDPHIPYLDIHGIKLDPKKLTARLVKGQDLVILVTGHTGIDYSLVAKNARTVLDCRNVFEKQKIKTANIVKL